MKTVLRRAGATAAATVVGVALLVAAKSGPGGDPTALRQPGVLGRPPAIPSPRRPVATAPPLPETTSSTAPATSSTTASPPPAATAPAPPTTAATTRPSTSSTTATTRPPIRPVPTTAPATRPTPTTHLTPTTAPATPSTQATSPPGTAAPTTTTTAPATTTTAPGTTTVDSPVYTVSHGFETYGPLQVRLTFQGHQIVDAVALQSPNHAAKSRQINARALPILRQEVLTAQSAQIDTVSGATSTSEAYAQAVQAILDQAWK